MYQAVRTLPLATYETVTLAPGLTWASFLTVGPWRTTEYLLRVNVIRLPALSSTNFPEAGSTLTIFPLTMLAFAAGPAAFPPGEQGLAAQGFFAAHGFLAAHGFFAAQGFLAAHGLAAQGFA